MYHGKKRLKSQKSLNIVNFSSLKQDEAKPEELSCCRSSFMRSALRQKYKNKSSAHGLI